MRIIREIFGYALGGIVFVALMPTLMWLASGKPGIWPVASLRMMLSALFIVLGLALSVWTIVHMRRKGDGNPMDAFGHEVAPRTKRLMTDGPYRFNRNPMLTGVFIYFAGVCVWLWTWQSMAVFAAFVAIMFVQVLSEEKRLLRDFGQEYEAYKKKVRRF